MEEIIDRLIELEFKYPIKGYHWTEIKNSPIPIKGGTSFEQNIYLKENLHTKLVNTTNLDNHYWVIQDWGKLKNFKKDSNDDLIRNFLNKLKEKKTLSGLKQG